MLFDVNPASEPTIIRNLSKCCQNQGRSLKTLMETGGFKSKPPAHPIMCLLLFIQFQNISLFLIGFQSRLIPANWLALTKYGRHFYNWRIIDDVTCILNNYSTIDVNHPIIEKLLVDRCYATTAFMPNN